MLKNFFKTAWRSLGMHKRMTLIKITGLSIGMAATVLMVIWIQNELSFDRSVPGADHIYRIKASLNISKEETWKWESSQYTLGDYARREIPEIAELARLRLYYGDLNLHQNDKMLTVKQAAYVDERWFRLFSYEFVEGSPAAFYTNPYSLVLTQAAARRFFGNQYPIGKILRIDTSNYQVQAVIKDNPANTSFNFEVLMPLAANWTSPDQKKNDMEWGNYNYLTFLKLRPGASPRAVAAKLQSIMHRNKKDDNGKSTYSLTPLPDIHFEDDLTTQVLMRGNRTIVNVFMVLAAFILLTACINYVNLTTARAGLRSREVSVRKIVGAGKAHLFGQFMAESLLITLIAVVCALAIIMASMPWFRSFTGTAFGNPLWSLTVWSIVGFTLLISVLLNGIYPALLLSSFQPLQVFKGKAKLSFKDSTPRHVLVIMQFVISIMLIAGTLVIYRQLNYVQQMNPGYNRSAVFSFTFPWWKIPGFKYEQADGLMQTVKQQLQGQSATAIVATAGSNFVNFNNSSSGNFDWPGRPKDFEPSFAPLGIDPDFTGLMQLKLARGRWLTSAPADKRNVLLNEAAVALIHLRGNPIGQRFTHQGDTGVIVGVVKDFHYKSLHEKIGPMILTGGNVNTFYIKTAPGNTGAAIAGAGKIWKQYFPEVPFDYTFLDEAYRNLYKAEQQQSVLITMFAAIALFISTLGLFGLAAFAAEQKNKEISIRKVLGASVQSIVNLLSISFIKMVVIASLIAVPIAWWAMNKWLQEFAYRIALSWWLFGLSVLAALFIAMATVSFQSIKAALANPVRNLRSE